MLVGFTRKNTDCGSKMSGIYRIFVSSTFTNLEIKCKAVQRDVFPRPRELCLRQTVAFELATK